MLEIVLVVSGNIGVSIFIAALRSGDRALAMVRNNAAVQQLETKKDITLIKSQVTDSNSVQKVVGRVKARKLPALCGYCVHHNLSLAQCHDHQLEGNFRNQAPSSTMLGYRIDYASVVQEKGEIDVIQLSVFSRAYEAIVADRNIKGCRITVSGQEDIDQLKFIE
ncbi:hypothetical protein CCMA1212_009156 [Trichoderma ghanense]|uniref:NmrA-like domain-containing protein n=1 Tax=Trichoderma ghanense TaxID=65468 RepID=A0ABY2GTN5_9HYPO